MPVRRGVWIVLILIALLGGVVLFAAMSLRPSRIAVPETTVLVLDVPSELEEAETQIRPLPFGIVLRNRNTLYGLVHALGQAADDDRIVGLVLHVDQVDWGWAKISEVRDAITRFRGSGTKLPTRRMSRHNA